jgi:superfamily II DNA helicase RecQ
MALKFFEIPTYASCEAEDELNAFLCSHRVVSTERKFVDVGRNSYWAICVDYLIDSRSPTSSKLNAGRNRIDYKSILSAEEFTVYLKLREWRKATAMQEAIPVYSLFHNEHLAQMVQHRCSTIEELLAIDSLDQNKVSKYAPQLLAVLAELGSRVDASSEPSVRPDPPV